MDKPIAIKIDEARQALVATVNNAKLPMCIMRPIIQDLLNEVITAEKQELITMQKKYSEQTENNTTTKEES